MPPAPCCPRPTRSCTDDLARLCQPEYLRGRRGVQTRLGHRRTLSQSERVRPDFRNFLVDATSLAASAPSRRRALSGENRILARFGLLGVNDTKLVGLRALIESARLSDQKIDSEHVASGWLRGSTRPGAWVMPTGRRVADAGRRAQGQGDRAYLESQNRGRQSTEREILAKACEMIEVSNLASDARRAIVLASENGTPALSGSSPRGSWTVTADRRCSSRWRTTRGRLGAERSAFPDA